MWTNESPEQNKQPVQKRGKTRVNQITIGIGFASDWLKNMFVVISYSTLHVIYDPITEVNLNQTKYTITYNRHLKVALFISLCYSAVVKLLNWLALSEYSVFNF